MKNVVNNDYTDLVQKSEIQLKQPSLYQVIMHNDDFTPMDFVVEILERIFFMDRSRATDTMFEVHTTGRAACGVYTKDVAITKVTQVIDHAQINEHPLFCTMEAAR